MQRTGEPPPRLESGDKIKQGNAMRIWTVFMLSAAAIAASLPIEAARATTIVCIRSSPSGWTERSQDHLTG